MIPAPWAAVVIVLAVYRLTRLVGWDDLPPIAKLRARMTGEVVYYDPTKSRDDGIYRFDRPVLAHFLGCPFCVGFWIGCAAYAVWLFFPTELLYVSAPLALSAAVGLIAKNLDA